MTDPLILTLAFDAASAARLDGWRARWFPDRGYALPAHLTLFHKLPGDDLEAVSRHLGEAARRTGPVPLRFARLLAFGGGTGVEVEAPGLRALRKDLASRWQDRLTRQDRGFRPHVTVQNKVPPETAARDRLDIEGAFAPWEGRGTGFLLWHYRGGPWEAAASIPFGGPPAGGIE